MSDAVSFVGDAVAQPIAIHKKHPYQAERGGLFIYGVCARRASDGNGASDTTRTRALAPASQREFPTDRLIFRERSSGCEVERVMGIEPTLAAWEAAVLPLNYTRTRRYFILRNSLRQRAPQASA